MDEVQHPEDVKEGGKEGGGEYQFLKDHLTTDGLPWRSYLPLEELRDPKKQ
jgi:hypothetical protein